MLKDHQILKLRFDSPWDALEWAKSHPPVKAQNGAFYRPPSSEKDEAFNGNCPFPDFYRRYQAPNVHFQEEIVAIIETASEILGELPTKNAKGRKRATARRGATPNVPALLSGNYSNAFTKFETHWVTKPPNHVAIFLPTSFSCWVSRQEIAYSTGTALALAQFLETEFGVGVDLWSVEYCLHPFQWRQEQGFSCIIQLKPSKAPLILEDVAPTSHPAWLRSLHFRLLEGQGYPVTGYGMVADSDETAAYILEFADQQGIEGHRVIAPGGHRGVIGDKTKALKWVEQQFRLLELID